MVQQRCRESGVLFEISDQELAIYQKLDISPPTLCPEARARRRLAWRNERTLYRRVCDATSKNIVSIFDKGSSFPVYSQEFWWSDGWDSKQYGRPFDSTRPFFDQFYELFSVVRRWP